MSIFQMVRRTPRVPAAPMRFAGPCLGLVALICAPQVTVLAAQDVTIASPAIPNELRGQVLTLYQEAQRAQGGTSSVHEAAKHESEACRNARESTERDRICGSAQRSYEACRTFKDGWESRRREALATTDRLSPGLGREYVERVPVLGDTAGVAVSKLRGVGPQPENEQRFNDAVRGLRTLEMRGCAGVMVNGNVMTPGEALAMYTEEERRRTLPEREPSPDEQVFGEQSEKANAGTRRTLAEEAAARARAAQQEADKRARAAALAEQEKQKAEQQAREMAEFEKQLTEASAGELFALGDQLASEGKDGLSRRAFRALISRFSDSQLALVAAQRLSSTSTPAAPAPSTAPGTAGGPTGGGSSAGSSAGGAPAPPRSESRSEACKGGVQRMQTEFDGINARRPASATTIQNMQVGLYMLSKSIVFIEANCAGAPEYAELAGYRNTQASLMTTCRQVASSEGVCVPRVAW